MDPKCHSFTRTQGWLVEIPQYPSSPSEKQLLFLNSRLWWLMPKLLCSKKLSEAYHFGYLHDRVVKRPRYLFVFGMWKYFKPDYASVITIIYLRERPNRKTSVWLCSHVTSPCPSKSLTKFNIVSTVMVSVTDWMNLNLLWSCQNTHQWVNDKTSTVTLMATNSVTLRVNGPLISKSLIELSILSLDTHNLQFSDDAWSSNLKGHGGADFYATDAFIQAVTVSYILWQITESIVKRNNTLNN